MPQAVFVQEGGSVDFLSATAVAAGDVVVQGDLVGVAKLDIPANRLGALAIEGVYDMAKAVGTAFTVGTIVYWDNVLKQAVTAPAGNKLIGKVVRAAAAADTTVRVMLSQ